MQPVLPTNMDRTSAQVLGFDAQAYLSDTKSTMHQRLNIPGTFNSSDYFMGSAPKSKKMKKENSALQAFGAVALAAGVAITGYFGIKKGKLKLPDLKGKFKFPKMDKIKGVFAPATDALKGLFDKIKGKIHFKK